MIKSLQIAAALGVADSGRIRVGAGWRAPPTPPGPKAVAKQAVPTEPERPVRRTFGGGAGPARRAH